MASYLASLNAAQAASGKTPAAPHKGLFGIGVGPDFLTSATSHVPAALGLRNVVSQFGQGLYGLPKLIGAAASPQKESSRALGREFLGGLGKQVAGIAVTPAELVGRHPFESEGVHGLGQQFKQQGLLPTLVNNLGLVAGGAGAAEGALGAFGGAASKLGAAGAAEEAAANAGLQASMISKASEAGASGERLGSTGLIGRKLGQAGKLEEEGISGPLLKKVAKTSQRAIGAEADAGQIERMQNVFHRLEQAKHPYQFIGGKVLRPLTRAGAAIPEAELAAGVERAQQADEAGALNDAYGQPFPKEAPGMSQEAADRAMQDAFAQTPPEPGAPPREDLIPPRVGQAQTAATARAQQPIPEWAQKIAGAVPESVRGGLQRAEAFVQNRELRSVRRETERFAEASRRQLLNEGGVPLAVDAAQQLLNHRDAQGNPLTFQGAPITAEVANNMVGDTIMADLEGRRMLEYMVSKGLDPTPELQAAVHDATGRKYPIPGEAMSQTLQSTLDQAKSQFQQLAGERERMLLGGHLADKGLQGMGSDELSLTPAETKKFRQIEAGFRKIAGLETDDQKVRLAWAKKQLALGSELDKLNESSKLNNAAAQRAFAKLRDEAMPATLTEANRAGTVATIQARIASDLAESGGSFGGGTFDPHTGTWEGAESGQQAAVGVAGTTVPTIDYMADPAGAINDFLTKYDTLLTSKDGKIGIFVDGETTYLDVSQTTIGGKNLSREQAVILGTARGEKSIWDFAAGGREAVLPRDSDMQIVASMHAKELARPGSQLNRYLRGFNKARTDLEQWQTEGAVAGALAGGEFVVKLDPNSWDDLLQTQMVQSAGLVANKVETTLDQVYGKMDVEARKTAKLPAHETLLQQYLSKDFMSTPLDKELWDTAMRDLGPEAETALNWYYENHNIIRERWGDETMAVFDEATQAPREVPIRDLMFSLLAVTSKNTSPGPNATYALQGLTALANLGDMHGLAGEMSDALQTYRETLARDKAAGRLSAKSEINADALYQALGAKITHMADVRADVMDVLHGHLVGDWDQNFIMQKVSNEPKFVARLAKEGRDITQMSEAEIMEAGGSDAYAKIRSFYENLAHPDTSNGVTLDRVMGQMLGLRNTNWAAPGVYEQAAAAFRGYADQMSVAMFGEAGKIKAHQAQALFWVWTKTKLQEAELGRSWASANDALASIQDLDAEAFRNGTDPISMHYKQFSKSMPLGDLQVETATGLGEPNKVATQVHNITGGEAKDAIAAQAKWQAGPGKRIADAIEAGDLAEAQKRLTTWVKDEQKRVNKPAETFEAPFTGGRGAGKLAERVIADLKESGLFREPTQPGLEAAVPEGGWNPALLQQSADESTMGMMFGNSKTGRLTMRFLRTADPTTLMHENAHLLRQLLPAEDVNKLLDAYEAGTKKITPPGQRARRLPVGAPGKVAFEERFAEDMLRHMVTGQAPVGLERVFGNIRDALTRWWDSTGDKFTQSVDPGVADVLNRYLDPAVAREAGFDATGVPGPAKAIEFAKLTPRQIRDKIGTRPGETPQEALLRGKRIGTAAIESATFADTAARDSANATRVENAIERMTETVAQSDIPGASKAAREQAALQSKFGTLLNKVETSPKLSTKPATWQPLWAAMDNLRELAKTNPEIANALAEIPETFTGFVQHAIDNGLDPTHVAHISDTRVRALVYGKLGIGGKLVEAATRKTRTGALDFNRSIEALAAAQADVIRESNNNALVQYIQQGHAIPIAPGEAIPAGYAAWDPARAFLNTTRGPGEEAVRAGIGAGAPRFVLPESTAKLIDRWANPAKSDYGLLRGIQKITNPWRALVLTWTPRWYLNNVIGNMILATNEGVKLTDWAQAWHSYKQNFAGDVGGAMGGDISRDVATGEPSLFQPAGYNAARAQGAGKLKAVGAGYNKLASKAARANTVVDDLARAAVYFSAERKGFSPEYALQRAYTAMVDYGDLSDIEQAYVRAAVPFYAWQKGILKQVIKFPVDHPVRAALMLQMGQLNQHLTQDLPDAYKGLSKVPGLGTINLRPFNPFADATALVTPQGIASSMNPFVEIVARNALDAPATGYPEAYRVDELGRAMPTTNPAAEALGTLLQTPQAGAVGLAPSGQNIGGFFGTKTYSPEHVAAIKARMVKSKAKQLSTANSQAGISNAKPKARTHGSYLSTLGK